jgi:hypothetical protein
MQRLDILEYGPDPSIKQSASDRPRHKPDKSVGGDILKQGFFALYLAGLNSSPKDLNSSTDLSIWKRSPDSDRFVSQLITTDLGSSGLPSN